MPPLFRFVNANDAPLFLDGSDVDQELNGRDNLPRDDNSREGADGRKWSLAGIRGTATICPTLE